MYNLKAFLCPKRDPARYAAQCVLYGGSDLQKGPGLLHTLWSKVVLFADHFPWMQPQRKIMMSRGRINIKQRAEYIFPCARSFMAFNQNANSTAVQRLPWSGFKELLDSLGKKGCTTMCNTVVKIWLYYEHRTSIQINCTCWMLAQTRDITDISQRLPFLPTQTSPTPVYLEERDNANKYSRSSAETTTPQKKQKHFCCWYWSKEFNGPHWDLFDSAALYEKYAGNLKGNKTAPNTERRPVCLQSCCQNLCEQFPARICFISTWYKCMYKCLSYIFLLLF